MKVIFFKLIVVVNIYAFVTILTFGQVNSASPQMTAANELLKAQKWAEAAKAYQAIVVQEPNNGGAWFQLAMAQFSDKQYQNAVPSFLKAVEISKSPLAMYNLACAYARLNQKEPAYNWLEKALASNMAPRFSNFADDSDLIGLRDDERFKILSEKIERKTKPCMFSPEARQFDFWVGEWEVFNPNGVKVGTSLIEKVAVGCGIMENWSAAGGMGSGKSLNFYDPQAGKWFQYWIGGMGRASRYSGNYAEKVMKFEEITQSPAGQKIFNRLTFFSLNDNTVRQFAETSTDEGKTWQTAYDFKYLRRK